MSLPDRKVPLIRLDERTGLMVASWYEAFTELEATLATLENSWVDWGGAYAPARYMKTHEGLVLLEGLIKDGTLGQPAFTLPVGFRPAEQKIFAVISNALLGLVEVKTNGHVVPQVGSTTYFSLEGIVFRAA